MIDGAATVPGRGLLGPPRAPDAPIGIGFQVWSMGIAWDDLMATGERIEAMGFSSLFANDHLMPVLGDAEGPVTGPQGPVFEGWMTLAAWAARTTRVNLGTMVAAVGYRNIGLTVKMATALDHASGGRMMLGLGAGWHEPEMTAFGYEPLTVGERISRLDEAAQVARGLLDGRTVSFEGRWIRAAGARNDPPPVQRRMPLLIAGNGEKRALRIVARDADIWNGEGLPELYAHRNAVLDGWCAEIGRDPGAIRRTVGIPPVCIRRSRGEAVEALAAILGRYGGSPAEARGWAASSPLADTEDVVAGLLRGWRAAGAEEAIIDQPSPLDDETMARLAGSVRERLA
ncbi:MAG TPA: LLM class flavin-dependent oxidoreductase [Candidatus Sulfotelmatobacter sp.]|nr:LLM class flavin-dependent oxidoreductase [Candidatus Sulfotelmatobacter sp.]